MTKTRRWMASVLMAAEETEIRMPWERGAPRELMIARRNQPEEPEALSA